jgi:hypothetical protein
VTADSLRGERKLDEFWREEPKNLGGGDGKELLNHFGKKSVKPLAASWV